MVTVWCSTSCFSSSGQDNMTTRETADNREGRDGNRGTKEPWLVAFSTKRGEKKSVLSI